MRRPSRCGKLRLVNCQVERHLQLLEGGWVLKGVIERTKVRLAPLPVSWGCARGDELGFEFGLVVLFGQRRVRVSQMREEKKEPCAYSPRQYGSRLGRRGT